MQTLNVELANRSYPIHIGRNLLADASLILPHLKRKHVAIVSNTTVAPLYLDKLSHALQAAGGERYPHYFARWRSLQKHRNAQQSL